MSTTMTLALLMQTAAPAACPAAPVPPPAALAGWSRRTVVTAGANAVTVPVGSGVSATLRPTAAVAYAVPPGQHAASGASGGLFAFTVPAAGRYRVALGAGAWIDVVENGAAAVSVAHGHGPACTGIAKTVDFDLKPGVHQLQVTGSKAATLTLMIARLP